MTTNTNMMVDTSLLPRDRVGLVVGKHVVAEYKNVGRHRQGHHYGYRVTMEADARAAYYHFGVDLYDDKGARPIGRMASFPSWEDCVQMARNVHAV